MDNWDHNWLKDIIPSDVSEVIRLLLLIAGCLVSLKAGFELMSILGYGSKNDGLIETLDYIIGISGIDSLIQLFYGGLLQWLGFTNEYGNIYLDLGFFIFAAIGPISGAKWYEQKVNSSGLSTNRYLKLIGKTLFIVLWSLLFGWAIIFPALFWPFFTYIFIFKLKGNNKIELLIQKEISKSTLVVLISVITGILLSI